MNAKEKIAALMEWLKQYGPLGGYLKLNVVTHEALDRAFNTSYNEYSAAKYIDGSERKVMSIFLVAMESYDSGYSDTNTEALEFITSWADWIDEQWNQKNAPDWGNCLFVEIKTQYGTPNLAGVDQNGRTAKYMMQVNIDYIERR